MRRTRRDAIKNIGAAATAFAFSGVGARSAIFPDRAVRIVVPATPAGALDLIARVLAQKLSEVFKQQVYVENKPGANWIIGMDAVAKSQPDGHTLLVVSGSGLSINPLALQNLPFDPFRDFTPITTLTKGAFVLVTNLDLPAGTIPEFIAYLKANPGKANHGSNSSSTILLSELFKSQTGTEFVDINYRGSAQAINDMISGAIQFCFVDYGSAVAALKGGLIRALAVTTRERYSLAPDIAPLAEQGLPNYAVDGGTVLLGPAKLPGDVLTTLNRAVEVALKSPEVSGRFPEFGSIAIGGPPEATAENLKRDTEMWRTLIKERNIHFEQ